VVIALAGRRIDAPNADSPRFPAAREAKVAARIEAAFRKAGARIVVCSAACGADLIGLEAAARLRMERHVVLPFAAEEFRRTSVVDRPGDWGFRFDRVMNAADVTVLGLEPEDREAYRKTNIAIVEHAAALGGTTAFVVWDGKSRGASDMTEHFRNEAVARRMRIIEIQTLSASETDNPAFSRGA
jgi:hypothetical protein